MDWYSLWESDILDAFNEFIASELSDSSLKQFLAQLNIGACTNIHVPISTAKLVLVYGNPDIILTSAEIEYLQFSDTAIMCDSENGFKIIALQINCYEDEYPLVAAAIIKIFNLMFSSNNLFIFKTHNKMSVGCKRDFNDRVANNFCLTDLFGSKEGHAIANIFGNGYRNVPDFIPEIIMNSKLEYSAIGFEKPCFDLDYVMSLYEIETAFDVDLTTEKVRYMNTFELYDAHHETYKEISQILRYVAEPNEIISSYEALNAAELAAEKAAKEQVNQTIVPELPDTITGINEAAFENAEIMLSVLINRDPTTKLETDIDKILKVNHRRS